MKHYIGLDVSMQETAVCVVDEQGKVVREFTELTDPQVLSKAIKHLKLTIAKVGIESGSISNWLVSELQDEGIPAICVDSRKMAAILSLKNNKNDKNDALGIAQAMRADMYSEVKLKSQEDVELGTLLSSRRILIGIRTKLRNNVRGLLKGYGIRIKTTAKISFPNLIHEVASNLSDAAKLGISAVLESYVKIDGEIKRIDQKLDEIAKKDEDVKLLMTIPGVGPITALCFKAIIGDPKRFEDVRNVGAYVGMTPKMYASGETEILGRISKKGNGYLRSLLYEAAHVMLTRSKVWSKPKAWAMKVQRRKGMKKATIALGRKLSVIMLKMLITKKAFEYGEQDKKETKKKMKLAA